eukprot:gnl/TRDRNA2_/TRDRNA2_174912_c9_seq16.p1 gnl/TRDRNA2_/TRDRNA2_174912_c9~~gnl/TRDRNA2_/TRDRNA2_174912_c9_seq16.p1  ORF type:complete len:372 (-),score=67.73 gnl/TRDRNA2_/TRDRNA2_174912_c9_seq16:333-1448(-)
MEARLARPAPRFVVGTQVVCRTGEGWQPGTIVALWWRPPQGFPPGFYAPYQVELDDGDLIFVPEDLPQLCQRRVLTWWEQVFKQGAEAEKVREAACGPDVDVDECDYSGSTALLESLQNGWIDTAQVLLELGANVNVTTEKGRSPLHNAVCMNGDVEDIGILVQALVEKKADPNKQDQDPDKDPEFTSKSFAEREKHRTPLHYCAAWDITSAAAVLVEAAANPNIIDSQYMTPLNLATREQASSEMVDLLLASKTDPNKINIRNRCSYLMDAARIGNAKLTSALISAKAHIDQTGPQDMTALHMAARGRHENVARILIEAGCDTNIKAFGKTAGELASTNGARGIAKLLSSEQSVNLNRTECMDDRIKKKL